MLLPTLSAKLLSVVGRVLGRALHLDPKKAHAIGEYFLLGVTASAAILVTVIYS